MKLLKRTIIVILVLTSLSFFLVRLYNQNSDIKEMDKEDIITPNEPNPNADDSDYLLCSDAIKIILEEHEYLERVEDPDNLIYRRGGYDKNQFTINFTNNTFILGHAVHSYAQFYVDEYFYYRDMSEEISNQSLTFFHLLFF